MTDIVKYTDIDINWKAHPLTGDVKAKVNIAAIQQAIKILFLLNPYDIPFEGQRYANIKRFLFEEMHQLTQAEIREKVEWIIGVFEKRVKYISTDITANDEENNIELVITYRIKALDVDDSVRIFFQRVR